MISVQRLENIRMNQRSIKSYHEECIEIETTQKYQLTEIAANRKTLLKKAKSTQEYRCLTSLRSGYCLRMTLQSVKSFVQLSFIRPEGFFVNDQFVHTLGLLKTDVNSFINSIYTNFTEMPKIFAKIQTDSLMEQVPFLPSNMKPCDFLACSTLPSLFCHCWSIELRHAYIDFLLEISKQLPPSFFPKFREHWLFECFKNYIHGSNIHQFLTLSIGEMILRLVRQDSNRGTQQIVIYAMEMIKRMKDNISTFPKDVRLLLKKFSDLAPNKEEKIYRIEILFIDCILVPAISLPKAYCVLPPSYQLDMSPNGPMKTLNQLALLLRMILHVDKIPSRFPMPQNEIDLVKAIPLADFLNELVNVDENKIDNDGPRIAQLISLLQTEHMNLMFTMSDVCLLAKYLVFDKPSPSQNKIMLSDFFTSDTDANLDFFRFEFQKCEVFGFKKPEIAPNFVEKPNSSSQFTDASHSLFKFLTVAKEHDEDEEKTLIRDLNSSVRRRKRLPTKSNSTSSALNSNNANNGTPIDNFSSSKFNSSVDVLNKIPIESNVQKSEASSEKLLNSYSNLPNEDGNNAGNNEAPNISIPPIYSNDENIQKGKTGEDGITRNNENNTENVNTENFVDNNTVNIREANNNEDIPESSSNENIIESNSNENIAENNTEKALIENISENNNAENTPESVLNENVNNDNLLKDTANNENNANENLANEVVDNEIKNEVSNNVDTNIINKIENQNETNTNLAPNTSNNHNLQYINYYKRITKLRKDYTTNIYLSNLTKKLDEVGQNNFNKILACLDDEIRRNREYLDRNDEILANIARMFEQLDAEVELYQQKAELSYPIIYSSLLQLFLESDKGIETLADEKLNEMMVKKSSFHEFYTSSILKLKSFITPIAEYALQGVASHFHTWLMQKMTLDDFIEANNLNDTLTEKIDKQLIEKICVEPAPPKLNKIFSSNQLFDFVMMELREAEVVEIPLEAVNYISSAINLIQRMFDLAIGGAPQADEMTPLFNYSLMSSGMNRMVSFEKYLEHFLYELPQNEIKLLNDNTSIALTHFINHVSSLTEIVDKCT